MIGDKLSRSAVKVSRDDEYGERERERLDRGRDRQTDGQTDTLYRSLMIVRLGGKVEETWRKVYEEGQARRKLVEGVMEEKMGGS